MLKPGHQVLLRNLSQRGGPGKLCAHWENDVYVIRKQRSEDIPVYCIAPESGNGKERTVHRNLLVAPLPVFDLRFLKAMWQLEVTSPRAGNPNYQMTNRVVLVGNIAHQYDMLMTHWANHRTRCHIYALFKQVNLLSQVLSCNNHLPMNVHT